MTTIGDAALENRENIPLQKGRKSATFCSCSEDYLSGSKFINVAFGTLTVIITAALLLQIYYGDYQVVPHGSVATDNLECSKIGTQILKKGGNSVDAAIASVFCLAVVSPHLTSLDGEGQLLIYNHRARLTPDVVEFNVGNNDAEHLLPRLVLGLAFVHQQYGTVPWKELVQPSAELARRGFLIPKMLVQAIKQAKAEDLYGRLEPGQILQLENLSNTLAQIANIPEKELYTFVKPENQPRYSPALKFTFNTYDIYVPDRPSIGPALLTYLKQLETFNFTKTDTTRTEYVYRLAELAQNLYNDLNLTSKYHMGTSTNVAVMDLNDNYVSFTTGLYGLFGSGEITTGGYTLDVHPKATPCSRLPVIITDAQAICGRRLLLGANDLSTASQLIMSLLVAEENITNAVEAPRFHILDNGGVGIEGSHSPSFTDDVLKYLETLTARPVLVAEPYMSSNVVEKVKDELNSHSDSRGGGIASRF
ncbi:glutathione hydrolase 7-like [Tribolium madens]|uniref:glutathione hydrolase 7-like n=1 Tax=Tribolium madens TaxID=41895 RepID=UPI001CF73B3D|nr:glutathione hydrolase 7-like [Tribolium madens]